jgi:hypothetical protein
MTIFYDRTRHLEPAINCTSIEDVWEVGNEESLNQNQKVNLEFTSMKIELLFVWRFITQLIEIVKQKNDG